MPNIVENWVRFTGPEASLLQLTAKPLMFEEWFPVPEDCSDEEAWKKQHWGPRWISKSEAGEEPTPVLLEKQADGSYSASFVTPWSPALRFLWGLQTLFPDLHMEYEYCDYMMGYCGYGTGQEEEQNEFYEYESKEDLDRLHSIRKWRVWVGNPHLED